MACFDPGIWLPLSSRVAALENRRHLSERSELYPFPSSRYSHSGEAPGWRALIRGSGFLLAHGWLR